MRWLAFDVLTGQVLGALGPESWKCSDPVVGSGGASLTHGVRGLDREKVAQLRARTNPDLVGIVLDDGSQPYLWAGIITGRKWKRKGGSLELAALDWRSWFYTLVLRPDALHTNARGAFRDTDTDQLAVLRRLAESGIGNVGQDPGLPPITTPNLGTSGVLRDVRVKRWSGIGEAMDAVAGRDNGMEWWVDAYGDGTTVSLELQAAHPGRGMRGARILLQSDSRGGNLLDYEWPEDATDRRTHVTALGEGDPPKYGTDASPAYLRGEELLREEVIGPISGVKRRRTLFDHARADRVSRRAPVESVQLLTNTVSPPLADYVPGDYARVRIRDEWLDVSTQGRIIDRQLEGGRTGGVLATLVVDLNDREPRSTDRGTVVVQ